MRINSFGRLVVGVSIPLFGGRRSYRSSGGGGGCLGCTLVMLGIIAVPVGFLATLLF